MFGKLLAHTIFKVSGWHVKGEIPADVKKCIMIAAPHTSNWDLIYARAAFYIMGIDVRYTIKKEAMVGPLGWILSKMGALPVDRSRNNSLVASMVNILNKAEKMVILITPEGTRKYQPRWRKGFYYTAVEAKVPIALGYLDYPNKEAGVGPIVYPTGDFDADLETIMNFYRTKKGKYPENGVR
ncbi:1-acyl-sn-glycerol-3-phosphate acyltransferase [Adhaeribacter aquaticus]|uniref:1-acyl-sn-glycerol-3-phosphate acyltransferase n=1 Tax=Adhaeribacter aquaticus TaxID=299567 RepID=UPI000413E7CB|nr:1-acyl-sn-glycerol-3-phosphate acyltransferase [Adhaeribacter aquaticus]